MSDGFDLLTIKEASNLLKVHPNTLRIWDKEGILQAIRLGRRNDIRYRRADLEILLNKKRVEPTDATQKLLANISDRVPAMVAAYNMHTGEYIYVNQAVNKLLGYSPEEFIHGGLTFISSLVHPEDITRVIAENQKALEKANKLRKATDEPIINFEYRMKHKNGTWKWLHTDGSVLSRSQTGEVEYVLNISLDITRRKKAEEKTKVLSAQLEEKIKRRTLELTSKDQQEKFLNIISKILTSSIDHHVTLKGIARAIVTHMADYCRVVTVDNNQDIQEISTNHVDRNKVELVEKLFDDYKNVPNNVYGIPHILKTGKSEIIPHIDERIYKNIQTNPVLYKRVRDLHLKSYMGIPLIARNRILGAITFSSIHEDRLYTRKDLRFVEEIGRRIALTLDNARLYQEAQKELIERRQIETKLLQNQERLELAHKVARMGTYEYDMESHKVYWSPEMEQLYGLKPGAFKGKLSEWRKFVDPKDNDKLQMQFNEQLKNGDRAELVFKITLPDRSTRWVYSKSKVFFDKKRRPKRAVGINMDVTERVNIENNLQFLAKASKILSSSLDYQTTLNTVAKLAVPEIADWCGVDIIDKNGQLQQVAVAHKDPRKVSWAKKYRKTNPPNMSASTGLGRVIKAGKSELYPFITDEMLAASATNSKQLALARSLSIKSAMMVPLFSENQPIGALTFITTDTGRHYNQQDLDMAEELASRASLAIENARLYKGSRDAIALRDDFISAASHELKTPITSVKIFTQVLQQHSKQIGDNRAFQYLGKMDKQLDKLTELIYNLLDISRIQAGKIEFNKKYFDFDAAVREIIDVLQASSTSHKLILKGKTGKLVYGDQDRIEQVVSNLISNAIKYSPHASKIIVDLSVDKGSVVMAVQDFGIGIAKEHMGKIFERFYRVFDDGDRTFPGLGIGLYISSQIIKRHDGKLWVESRSHKGSTFFFSIPIKKKTK